MGISCIIMQTTYTQDRKGIKDIDPISSLIFYPHAATSDHPIIVGILRANNGKPLKNRQVKIYIDGSAVSIVTSDKNGVFKYQLRNEVTLSEGKHCVYGVETKDNSYVRGSIFTVTHRSNNLGTKSGNVDPSHSGIWFPVNGGMVGESTFSIICGLYDASNNVVTDETLTFKTDSTTVSNNIQSDSNGLGIYTLTSGQALTEGMHTADVHAQESDVDLMQVSFEIDLTAPDAPIIATPMQDDVINNSTVIISGTAEVNATVYVFLDGDEYGEITYPDENGDWSIEYDNINDGPHSVYAYQTDAVQHQSDNSPTTNFTVSTF